MNFSRFFFFLSSLLFVLFVYFYYQQNNPQNISFAISPEIRESNIQKETSPTGLIIPSIHVWLPIYPATIQSGNWETTAKGVSYFVESASVGSTGNAIFYGHDWPNLLGNLHNVHPGDTIQIVSKTGREFFYEVSTIQEVNPTDVSILTQTKDSRITIYTCTGLFDSKRLVVVALLKN